MKKKFKNMRSSGEYGAWGQHKVSLQAYHTLVEGSDETLLVTLVRVIHQVYVIVTG